MPKMKTYVSTGAIELPGPWYQRVNTQTHHIQGYVLIVAASKAAAISMLAAAGIPRTAGSIMRKTTLRDGNLPTDVQTIVDAGAADLNQPGAYAWRRSDDGNVIARVDDPALPIVGIFRLVEHIEDGKRTYRTDVEPFTEVQS